MRNTLLPAALLLLAGGAPAQTLPATQVPAATKATFKARFPTVQRNTWEKEGAAYEASFQLNGKAMSAVITLAGQLRETETDLPPAELPAAVRATLARDYKAYRVKEAATITKADGRTVYEAAVAKGGQQRDVLFTAQGQVVPR